MTIVNGEIGLKLLEIVFSAIALLLLVPVSVLWTECTAAFLPQRRLEPTPELRPRVNVLIPAHNEEMVLRLTLENLLPQLMPQDRLIAIADNCNDETASVARSLGVEVIERQEPERRGKGYALDYGLKFIAQAPPEVVVVIDADSIIAPGTLDCLARLTYATNRPVQATYLLTQPANSEPKQAISALAFLVKNLVRPRGLDRLSLPCLLTGTGMAFPWKAIETISLASGNIVEDMQLGLDLAIAGYPPMFSDEAKVTGLLPQQQNAAKSQRTRWEHGHLQTLLTQVPRLLQASWQQKSFPLFALALDLCVPPLSLLVIMWLSAVVAALSLGWLGAIWVPLVILAVEGLLILLSIFEAWAGFGRTTLPLLALIGIPLYILWKIPLYLAFLAKPQTKWIRTDRDVVEEGK